MGALAMTSGFGTVPEELRSTAGKIGEVIAGVADAIWQPPSGNYGHPGVQSGWASFIEQMKSHVEALREQADEHGRGLITAATSYLDLESNVGDFLTKAGSGLESLGGAIGSVLGGAAGFVNSDIAGRLNPEHSAEGREGPVL